MSWLPISTAKPTKGKKYVLCIVEQGGSWLHIGIFIKPFSTRSQGFWMSTCGHEIEPTHWLPIDELPTVCQHVDHS